MREKDKPNPDAAAEKYARRDAAGIGQIPEETLQDSIEETIQKLRNCDTYILAVRLKGGDVWTTLTGDLSTVVALQTQLADRILRRLAQPTVQN